MLQTLKKQATSATAVPAETSTSRGTLDELAERLGNFHDSARALSSCLQKHDVSRKTDQSMIEAAKCMFPSPSSRCNQTVTSESATLTERSTRADVTCSSSSTRLYQRRQDLSMPGMRLHKAETSNTQSVTTSTLHVQSRSGSRCVRDRSLSRRTLLALLNPEYCLYGNNV